ncbi:MAG: threonine-phosphate decarboxylase CobD [Candidatus Dactylopiibacterium sp.]|nr:threonine-phosphate decarboxylase CobD [Candidatus Dactylopiibacterium sp.]
MSLSSDPERLHGGRLRAAAHAFRIPLPHWLDLSTGIHPHGWPVPPLPADVWRRLPEDDDGLALASFAYFCGRRALPLAGSQAAIQSLPQLFTPRRVAIVTPCYAEHARAWRSAGHDVASLAPDAVDAALENLDVLVLTHPNNPTGQLTSVATLRDWHARLAARGGLLVVDEAFIDATPQASLLADPALQVDAALVVLRSLGKFWGLAGLRCGFVVAHDTLLASLADRLGPWAVSHPARWVAQRALADRAWQARAATQLAAASARLATLLAAHGLDSPSGCALFRWVPTPRAHEHFAAFAEHAVLVRAFDDGLRFGLPGEQAQWQQLEAALAGVMR